MIQQTTSDLKSRHLSPVKYHGQHFLISGAVVKKIIAAANLEPGERVLEIGPGTGVLTRALLEAGAKVIAVEKDESLTRLLISNFQFPISKKRLTITIGDILQFDETKIKKPYKIVANIPYYITGPIIQKFLFSKNPPREMVLMVQKEVGQRIAARPPKANYLSSLVQSFAETKVLFKVKRDCFWPRPKVDSAVIKITPSPSSRQPKFASENFIEFLKIVFRQPRQTLWNNLRRSKTIPADKLEAAFKKLGLDKNIRGQNLDQQQLKSLFYDLIT
ncbi:MAG: ribosomal RNA small subunit methyltransferase A [Parcubacteria group bacterium]|nr:ribosomal RNA small subunit methyltransferase A [Parcubacteria group bacterium]